MEVDERLKDKYWRVNNLYKIVDKNSKLKTYKLNRVQQQLEKNKHTRNIILKARQLGITTYACIDMLDDVLFNNNFNAVIIAHDLEAVKKIFRKVKLAWENFPLKDAMGYEVNTDSANELSFNNGSFIRVSLSSRADTVNHLHISEFGKICRKYPQKAEEIITGAIPSVPESGRIDIESTAEGEFGSFYDMFWDAWNNKPLVSKQFKAHFFPWTDDNQYKLDESFDLPKEIIKYQEKHNLSNAQINWYYIEKLTQKGKMMQEYPTTPEEAFLGSGNKLFDADRLSQQRVVQGKKVNDWIYYNDYQSSHRYALGADVAEGVGQDSSTAVIMDFTPLKPKVVAEYASNKIAPDTFAHELKNGATRYGNCLIACERNNHGFATLSKLKEIYSNIYRTVSEQRDIETRAIGNMPIQKTFKYGWHTNAATKPKMLYDLNEAINEELIEVQSKRILEELRTYDKEDLSVVRFDDEQTKHWDLIIALAICWQMRSNLKELGETKVYTFKQDKY